jgi:hypothetical protein
MATMPKASPRIKPIEVTAKGHADKDPETLSINNEDQATFFCQNDDVNVVFDFPEGSPFEKECFHVHKGKANGVASGPVRKKGVPVGGQYRYRIYSMKGAGPSADPTIIVEN